MLPVAELSGLPMWHISSGPATHSPLRTTWNLPDLRLSSQTFKAVATFSVAVSHYPLDRYRLRHRFEFGIVLTGQLTTKRETRAESLDFQILLLFTPLFLP